MRQTYYGVSSETFTALEDKLKQYSELTKQLFHPRLEKEQRMIALTKRTELKNTIQAELTASGVLLGFINDGQIEEWEATVSKIENEEIGQLLRSNCIPFSRLESVLAGLMSAQAKGSVMEKAAFFLERAEQQRQNVIVWIV
ncbi:hypothetical protein RAC89_00340 [Paenibacillus sp. GD4]|uniref:hypothetical protein n=1 Tax=Paenibacillus sp. GD4 TaxID=3068890 RepID=UPI0027969003|nr:hypothetical protein [Paenibacillus sp. GD4]MDQ1908946.1 hypothetical protein [Paenibacillus sp. GD4]